MQVCPGSPSRFYERYRRGELDKRACRLGQPLRLRRRPSLIERIPGGVIGIRWRSSTASPDRSGVGQSPADRPRHVGQPPPADGVGQPPSAVVDDPRGRGSYMIRPDWRDGQGRLVNPVTTRRHRRNNAGRHCMRAAPWASAGPGRPQRTRLAIYRRGRSQSCGWKPGR